jgi:type II secretory pathway pseudopilin PulG
MGKRINKKKKLGHTLIEALIALGILLLGIVPVITLSTHAILFHHRAAEAEEAARISQTMIDYIKSRGYDELELMVDTSKFSKKYDVISTTGGAFTVENFGSRGDFNIPQEMILLNSNGINLNDVDFYVVMDKVRGDLKDYKKDSDSYIVPSTGETISEVYTQDLIYGKFIFGLGEETADPNKKTGRQRELKTTFIITPIENWK